MAMTVPAYRLPEEIERKARGGPVFSTVIHESVQGTEQRVRRWARCRSKYDISYSILRSDDPVGNYRAVQHLFYGHVGNLFPFRFKTWIDWRVTDEAFGSGESGATRQLIRTYDPQKILLGSAGTRTYVRTILLPNPTGLVIKINGTPTAAYTLGDAGQVIFNSDPGGASLTWSGSYDLPMRFDSDYLPIIMREATTVQVDKITIREVVDATEITSPGAGGSDSSGGGGSSDDSGASRLGTPIGLLAGLTRIA